MSKQITTVAGYLDEPRFGTTKNGKPYLSCSIPVKVETDRGQNNEFIYTTYRYQFSLWGQKAEDYHARNVLVKGQYVVLSGTVKMTAYINDHPKNPQDKGKPGINIDFLPGFDLDLGARPSDAPPVVARAQGQGDNQGYNNNNGGGNNYQNRGNNGGYNNNRGNGGNNYQNNNYQNRGNGGNNYNNQPAAPAQPPIPGGDQGWEQQGQAPVQPNQYSNYTPSPYGE